VKHLEEQYSIDNSCLPGTLREARVADAVPEMVGRLIFVTGGASTPAARTFHLENPWIQFAERIGRGAAHELARG
jgi:hypothetical protein